MNDIYYYEYEYDSYYCYQDSNILKNKFNYKDQELLSEVERRFSAVRTEQLLNSFDGKKIDSKLLKHIHKYIFQDVYEWAGEYRKVDIAKGNMFCRSTFIPEQVEAVMQSIDKDYINATLDKNEVAVKIAHFLGDINAIHPFREGNGRTQRIFIKLLAQTKGYDIDYSKISKEEMLEASKRSFDLDYSLMEEIIKKSIEPYE